MSTVESPVSDMLLTVKSREIQRGMSAEARGDDQAAARHFLAAAHLELVVAEDYSANGQDSLAFRSRLSAASCLWRGGKAEEGREILNELIASEPQHESEIRFVIADLEKCSR
jgi:hypothetical protein